MGGKAALSVVTVRKMVRWYLRRRRDLPWRRMRKPYAIWISEIFLQQTRVETVRPYFLRFIQRFPTVTALARAHVDEILKAWEGCGYYARARNLHRAAQMIHARGRFPTTAAEWRKLPGVGPYSAAAIASIAYGEPVAAVDGNLKRVLARVLCEDRDITGTTVQARIQTEADRIVQLGHNSNLYPGDINQALMEIGATVCLPRRAQCPQCPLEGDCRAAHTLEDPALLPVKARAKAIPHYEIGAAIIHRNGKILITQRPHEGMLGGLWEFPGGKRDAGETREECVAREITEELGIAIEVGPLFAKVRHAYSHFRITLYAYDCQPLRGRIRKLGIADYRWVTVEELEEYAFPKADKVIIEKLKN
jgi:A/G-specific adenine glycosylase